MRKKILYIAMIILLSGCAITLDNGSLLDQVNQLEQALDDPNWNEINEKTYQIKSIYEKNKWKIQLLGDEGEYEGLNEGINRVIAATKERDTTNVRLELATVKSLIKDIYSL